VTHPPLFTVEESRALRGKIPGGHSKNLFLRDKKSALFLVTALEDAAIELKSLHRALGATGRFSFGSAELMLETLGIEPGSVTPFAALNDTAGRVTVVLDTAMMEHDRINFHPLRNTMTTTIARDDLVRFLEATGHPPTDFAGFTGRRRTRGNDCNRFHGHHLIGHNPIIRASRGRRSQGQQDGRTACFRTRPI
jgi:Ala-tRNA(Pro) deacylase